MKITNQLLDKLIAEQFSLSEDTFDKWDDLFTDDKIKAKGNPGLESDASARSSFNTLKKLTPPPDKLDDNDLDNLLQNLDLVSTDVQKSLYAIKYGSKNKDFAAKATAVLRAYEDSVADKALEPQTFSEPKITTTRGEQGAFSSEISAILDRVFVTEKTLATRIKRLSDISKRFYLASGALAIERAEQQRTGSSKSPSIVDFGGLKSRGSMAAARKAAIKQLRDMDQREFINQVMLMEYFVEISKSFDAGSGGYVFEWFLALLAGGYVTGKEKGPAGGMGAVDFRYKTGGGLKKAGSAKYYAKKSQIKQSVEGFRVNEQVGYVIALKKQGMEQLAYTNRGASDPTKIVAAEIYTPNIIRRPNVGNQSVFEIDGVEYNAGVGDKAKIDLSGKLGDLKGILYIADVPTESFRDMMYRSVQNSLTQKKDMILRVFESFFSTLSKTDKEARLYNSTGNIDHGDNTLNLLAQADDQFEELMAQYGDKPTVTENNEKLTEEILDKMIERVILESK